MASTVNNFQQIRNNCSILMETIRNSNLNFSLQEAPFSIYVTIRKSFSTVKNLSIQDQNNRITSSEETVNCLKRRCENLEGACQKLQRDLEEEINKNEAKEEHLSKLSEKLENLESKLDFFVAEAKAASDDTT